MPAGSLGLGWDIRVSCETANSDEVSFLKVVLRTRSSLVHAEQFSELWYLIGIGKKDGEVVCEGCADDSSLTSPTLTRYSYSLKLTASEGVV